MKTYVVVYEGKTFLVKGKGLQFGTSIITIIGSNDESVAIFPIGAFVADKAYIEEQAAKKPARTVARPIA